jgi:hypothetical protein
MSRRKPNDNSATVSLFPFLAVLLCTMGALLVVLVAVSRSARNSATSEAQSTKVLAAAQVDPEAQKKLTDIADYAAKLNAVRAKMETKLRQDQLRLGQLESHMRQLQDELRRLVLAANELDALEIEHYDDHRQAQKEVERLNRLIAECETAIAALKNGGVKPKRNYALVPYEGPNGTFRRPIYIECCEEGLILQPEGVLITYEDLQPPLGSGNALAAALRAARDYYVQRNPEEGQSRDTEPYPMLLIRPNGLEFYSLARKAIDEGDFDFGFEPVEANWNVDFGAANPQLANVEQQAIEQARIRQKALAEAAPRAYSDAEFAVSRRFEHEDEANGPTGSNITRSTYARPSTDSTTTNDSTTDGDSSTYGDRQSDASQSDANSQADGSPDRYAVRSPGGSGPGSGGPHDATQIAPSGEPASAESSDGLGPSSSGNSSTPPPGDQSGQTATANSAGAASSPENPSAMRGTSSSFGGDDSGFSMTRSFTRSDKDKAVPNFSSPRKHSRAVAVRRPIRVVVREDQVGLVSDEARAARSDLTGKTIPFEGDTIESMQEFVKAVEEQVNGWGIAGDNLYWRPMLELQVGPDGQRRAEDMARLLKNSDLEVQIPSTATQIPQGAPSATR